MTGICKLCTGGPCNNGDTCSCYYPQDRVMVTEDVINEITRTTLNKNQIYTIVDETAINYLVVYDTDERGDPTQIVLLPKDKGIVLGDTK